MKFKFAYKSDGWMEDTPTGVDRRTGIIYINPKIYNALPPFDREFWIWHEKGHYLLDTDCEFTADEYAFNKMAGTRWKSLKHMVAAAERLLSSGSKEHEKRIEHLYNLALAWDKAHGTTPKTDKAVGTANKFVENQGRVSESQINATTVISSIQAASAGTSQVMLYMMLIIIVCVAAFAYIKKQ